MNVGVILACVPCLVMSMYTICAGKFAYGFFAGGLVNVVAISVVETIPKEQIPIFGSLINVGIVGGVTVFLFLGLLVPAEGSEDLLETDLWMYLFSLPAAIAIVSICLALFVFRYETLTFLLKEEQLEEVE